MTVEQAPYCLVNDNIAMLLFVLSLIGIAHIFLVCGSSIIERAKSLFYYSNRQSNPFNERTHITKWCNALLYWQTIFYCGTLAFIYLQYSPQTAATSATTARASLAGCMTMFAGLLVAKKVIYDLCNNILWGKEVAKEWSRSHFFTIKLLSFVLLPLLAATLFIEHVGETFMRVYLIFATLTYIAVYISSLNSIIFRKKCNYLDIFLYLCALELLPVAIMWKLTIEVNSYLLINF